MDVNDKFRPDYVCGKETMAYTFEGVKYDHKEQEMIVTNGKCIVTRKFDKDEAKGMNDTGIIPAEIFKEIRKGKKSTKKTMKIKKNSGKVTLEKSDGSKITKDLIEGKFPKHKDYIPDDYENYLEIGLDAKQLADIVSVFKGDGRVSFKIEIDKNNELKLNGPYVVSSIMDGTFDKEKDAAVFMPVVSCIQGDKDKKYTIQEKGKDDEDKEAEKR